MTIEELYTPIEEAKKEIQRRWADKDLEKKVTKFLKGNIPDVFLHEPRAVSTTHVATPNWALLEFRKEAQEIGLKPIIFEYLEDTFITTNFDKASLARMVFYHGRDDHGDMMTTGRPIIDLTGKEEKKRIIDIKTLWDHNLVDFHHEIFMSYCPGVDVADGSSFYKAMGHCAKEYYPYILALYIRNGVLFENYIANKHEQKFLDEVLFPAFEIIEKEFGLKPLIVTIAPQNEADNKYWWCYPEFIKTLIPKNKDEEERDVVHNFKKASGFSLEELQELMKKWQIKLKMEDWNLTLEVVKFYRGNGYRQSGDFIANSEKKEATILMTHNPWRSDEEYTLVHEMLHILLYDYDKYSEDLILKNFQKSSVEHDAYMEKLEETTHHLTRAILGRSDR